MQHGAGEPPFSRHFDGKRFFNPDAPQARGFLDVLRWKLTSRAEPSPRFVSDVEPSKPPSCVEGGELRVTLINHSTVLLQQGGSNILTDPIWSERASPLTWVGPRRRRKPGVRWEDLPRIDIVLLSHNHYDHLDLATLRRLADRGQSQFIVPVGVARCCDPTSIGPVQRTGLGRIAATRTDHHSQRAGAAFFCARNLRPQSDSVVRIRDRSGGPHGLFCGRHGFRRPFRSHPRAIWSAAPGAAADRSLRAALVHVAGSYGSGGSGKGPSTSWAREPASRSTTERSNWRTTASTRRSKVSASAPARFVSGAGQRPIRDAVTLI